MLPSRGGMRIMLGAGATVATVSVGTRSTNGRIDDINRRMDDLHRRIDDGHQRMNNGFKNLNRRIDELDADIRELRTLAFEAVSNETPAN